MRKRSLYVGVLVVLLVVSSELAYGETYYVRHDGSDGNDGLSNTAAGAWLTIDKAADTVTAGDVVRVQAGTYAERVTPTSSGMSGNPITFVADGLVIFCGMDISSRNYLRVIGFTMDTNAGGCTKNRRVVNAIGTNTGLEFWNNTFRDANESGIAAGTYADRQHNFLVIGNTFTAIGCCGAAVSLRGNNNILAYNEVTAVDPDAFVIDGTYSRWLNNYIHDMVITAPAHGDGFQSNSSSLGLSYNIFEANFIEGLGDELHEHGVLLQNQTVLGCSTGTCGAITENLFRFNVWDNIGGGTIGVDQPIVAALTNTRQVHDTMNGGVGAYPSQAHATTFNGSGITAFLHNNLHYQTWGTSVTSGVKAFEVGGGASITTAAYNLAYDPDGSVTFTTPWASQANGLSNVNPSFTNVGSKDFTIQSGSGARNAGGPLTTVSGSGSGSTFRVEAGGGGFFRGPNAGVSQYGGNMTSGDLITVGTTTRTVGSVSGDAITVTSPLTWSDGDPVYLGTSTTPDIGAYPYRPDVHNLTATYAVSSGTVTVSPSADSLVRFVICYEDGIPTTVDNASPYRCSVGTGSLDVRVYPRYASRSSFVRATLGLASPTNLRITH